MSTKISALNAAGAVAAADVFPVNQSGTTYKQTMSALSTWFSSSVGRWRTIAASKYTATPASTSQITMSDTSDYAVGLPIKFTTGGVSYYAIVTAMVASTSITIVGAPLTTGSASITALYVGNPEMVQQMTFAIPGSYAAGSGSADILSTIGLRYFQWRGPTARLVAFSITHTTGTGGPYVNVAVAGNAVSTANTNQGVVPTTSWVHNTAVAVDVTNYVVAFGNDITIPCVRNGATVSNLSVLMTFVII